MSKPMEPAMLSGITVTSAPVSSKAKASMLPVPFRVMGFFGLMAYWLLSSLYLLNL